MRYSFKNIAVSVVLVTSATVALSSCGMPLQFPTKESRRASAQLIDAAQHDGNLLSDSTLQGYDLSLFPTIYRNAQDQYVHPVDGQVLIAAALSGVRDQAANNGPMTIKEFDAVASEALLASLDDYSTYFDEKTFRAFQEQTRGAYAGLGIEISKHDRGLLIISPFEESPAYRAGLKAGDIITHADGRDIAPMTVSAAVSHLRGRIGSSVNLTIERAGASTFKVSVRRDLIKLKSVRWDVEGDVGYIRITSFSDGVGVKIREAIGDIEDKLGERLYGYVLDLRSNPGGLLTEAIDVSGTFLEGNVVVSTREREGEEFFSASPWDASGGKPVVVLIDQGSASASEIVAGALQDHNRAILMGARSFGKGSVQTVLPLYQGGALKLTTALYFTPSGRTVNGGIRPDRLIDDDPDKEGDEQLVAAYKLIVELAGGPDIIWSAGAQGQ